MKLNYEIMEGICNIVISEDDLEAHMSIQPPSEELEYEKDAFLQYLNEKGIREGIDSDALSETLEKGTFNKSFLIAKGIPAINGEDGFFEFFFDKDLEAKPKVMEDGSVDYLNMKLFEEAEEGQLLVRYHPETKGIPGKGVSGKPLKAIDGKRLPPIKGSGFEMQNDGHDYVAKITGRILFKDNRLKIDPLYIVDEVSYSTGNVRFRGDVLVKGAVRSGMVVEATGDVMVNGNIESATIVSGGNVLVRRGATSDLKGKIKAKGNVSGKFFESVYIEAGNNVYSDYFLNCDITAESSVIATGRKGSLAGGITRCWDEVHVINLGNRAGVLTVVSMFYETNIPERLEKYLQEMDRLGEEILSIQKMMESVEKKYQGKNIEFSKEHFELRCQLVPKEKRRQEVQEEWLALREIQNNKNKGNVIVENIGYVGCRIGFGALEEVIKDSQREFKITRRGEKLIKDSLPNRH